MNQPSIPVINRRLPRIVIWLMWILYYLLFLPITWLINFFGLRIKFLYWIGKFQKNPKRLKKAFKGYEPNDGDVFVSTFAKSGTNWMMQMSHQIVFHGNGEYENIHDVVCWPDMRGKHAIALKETIVQKLSSENKRVIKTHISAHYVPYNEKAHYIVVIRDPKEVFVSSFHFFGSTLGPLMPSSNEWFDLFLSDRFLLNFGNSWAEHTASYWALKDKPNVLLLSYSKMKKDLEGTVSQVSDFLGATLTAEELNHVIEKSSFKYMKNIDHKFSPMPQGGLPGAGDFKMMREGKEGNSGEMISLEQQMLIDKYFQAELQGLASDFPYAEFCNIAR